MNTTKVYVAGSFKNREKIRYIMSEIENWGFRIAADWTIHQEKGGSKLYATEDLQGLKECDCLVYCMDSNHSRGKNFELGYITALKKPIIIYIMPENDVSDIENLSIDSLIDRECVFIRARLYPIISSMGELRLWLDNLDVKLLLSKVRKKQIEDTYVDTCQYEDT